MKEAMAALMTAVEALSCAKASARTNAERCTQIGIGMRADKRRTWRFRDDTVADSITGMTMSCKEAMRGNIDKLWPENHRLSPKKRS